MVSSVFVSVIRAWRFAKGSGTTDAVHDLTSHRQLMGALHGRRPTGRFTLPWPPFRSRYWEHTCNRTNYENTPPDALVAALVPQRAIINVIFPSQLTLRRPLGEVFLQPFGVWTALSVDLLGAESWSPSVAATQLDDALHTPTDASAVGASPRLLREGVRLPDVEAELPGNPWQAKNLVVEEAGDVVVASGLSDGGADIGRDAQLLANHFSAGGMAATHQLTRGGGAIAVTGSRIGIALAAELPRAPARVKCLHHNHTLLLGQLMTLGSIIDPPTTARAEPFQRIAAKDLNHIYRAEPIPGAGVYKSRTSPAWLLKKGLAASIDRVNTAAGAGLPPLTAPPKPN
jgi:hypothetical protein